MQHVGDKDTEFETSYQTALSNVKRVFFPIISTKKCLKKTNKKNFFLKHLIFAIQAKQKLLF